MSLKPHFSRFLSAAPGRLHFAAHSHHLWPDVTLAAQEACWTDAARLADRKWDKIFSEVYPAAQGHVARLLGLRDPTTVAFAPNTHSFLLRLLSSFPAGRTLRVLTSDSEFHSFARQMRRLEEDRLVAVARVPSEPFASFTERFAEAAAEGGHDLIYVSQVFYNSGYAITDLDRIVGSVPNDDSLIVIDGYHGFLARPTDLSAIQDRAFYMSGGYKYAMAGEGVVFLHAPPGYAPRPRDTGWYAAFGALESGGNEVGYAADAGRFLGATFDPVGLYRFNAVIEWLNERGLSVSDIQEHAHGLQRRFIAGLDALGLTTLTPEQLVVPLNEPARGNFLTFRTDNAGALNRQLLDDDVITDWRGDRLRFGFGLYQDEGDVDRLCKTLGDRIT